MLRDDEQIDITRRYGLRALGYATFALATTGMVPSLDKYLISQAKAADDAEYKLRFGTVINPKGDAFLQSGMYHLAKTIEEKSDGRISVQLIDAGQACAEVTCAQKVANGVLDMGSASSTNLGAVAQYSHAIDWPFLWESREQVFDFLFSPDSEKLYRSVLRDRYGIEVLHYYGDLRSVFMGEKYAGAEEIRTPDALSGAKFRISPSEMFQIASKSLGMSPIPLAWVETLEGMKSGVVDAMETGPSAAAGWGMTKVSAQAIDLNFSPFVCPAFVSSRSFEKLPDDMKEVVYESAWEAQKLAYEEGAVANNKIVGSGPDPDPESNYQMLKIKDIRLTPDERAAFVEQAGVEANLDDYASVRAGLDGIAGYDVYGAIKEAAEARKGKSIELAKWWT